MEIGVDRQYNSNFRCNVKFIPQATLFESMKPKNLRYEDILNDNCG